MRSKFRPETDLMFDAKDGRTKQSFKKECDINFIVSQFEKTGLVSHTNERTPQYLDVSAVPDFQKAHDFVAGASSMFFSLPENIQIRFERNPAKLMEFMSDIRNRDEAVKLGLIQAPPVVPAPVPAAAPAPTGPDAGKAP